MAEFKHISVLLEKSIELLGVSPEGIYADGTLGGGGHSELILKKLSGGRLIGIDRDKTAIEAAKRRLAKFDNVTFVHGNFADIDEILDNLGIEKLDGAILDLGVSSYQLDTPERGFSYRFDAPLDMRMDATSGKSAYDVVNGYTEAELADVIFRYGEEKLSRKIARIIAEKREIKPIETTGELVEIIKKAYGKRAYASDKHPAKRTFQAIRIEVNGELEILGKAVEAFFERLRPGGRLAVITFHSLEDRIVKNEFKKFITGCTCPPNFPVCVCGGKARGRLVNRKAETADACETEVNPRSKCAKLRCIEKI